MSPEDQRSLESPESITYEFPLNERVRTLLRLEDMFDRLEYFMSGTHPLEHHTALTTLFEIMDGGSRADLKSDLLQELERQRQALTPLKNHPNINQQALQAVLTDIEQATAELASASGRLGQHLRDNEWLMAIRSRTSIPGGVCEFDLPAYYAWQQLSAPSRRMDLAHWVRPMMPLINAIRIVLKLLRESGETIHAVANNGSFTQPMSGKTFQMLQLRLPDDQAAIPEFSANKYMLWIRFNQPTMGLEAKNKPIENDLAFQFKLCTL